MAKAIITPGGVSYSSGIIVTAATYVLWDDTDVLISWGSLVSTTPISVNDRKHDINRYAVNSMVNFINGSTSLDVTLTGRDILVL